MIQLWTHPTAEIVKFTSSFTIRRKLKKTGGSLDNQKIAPLAKVQIFPLQPCLFRGFGKTVQPLIHPHWSSAWWCRRCSIWNRCLWFRFSSCAAAGSLRPHFPCRTIAYEDHGKKLGKRCRLAKFKCWPLETGGLCSDEGLTLERHWANTLFTAFSIHQPLRCTLYVLPPRRRRPKLVLTGTSIQLYHLDTEASSLPEFNNVSRLLLCDTARV